MPGNRRLCPACRTDELFNATPRVAWKPTEVMPKIHSPSVDRSASVSDTQSMPFHGKLKRRAVDGKGVSDCEIDNYYLRSR